MAITERTDPPADEPTPGVGLDAAALAGPTEASPDPATPPPSRVGRNISALAGGQMVTWTTGIVAAVIVPRLLGPSELGSLVTAASAASLFGVLLGFVTVNYLVREMVARPTDAPAITGTAMAIRLAMVPIFLGAIVVFGYIAGFGATETLILYLIALATAINVFIEPIQAAFQALERMEYVALTSVISQSSSGLIAIALVLVGVRAVGIAASTLGVAIVALGCNLYWARGRAPIERAVTKEKMRALARGGLPYMTIGVAVLMYTWLDAVILSLLAPSEVVGWYGVCTRLFATLLFIPTIICTAWFPKIVSAHHADPDELWSASRPNVELVFVLGVAAAVATAVGAAPVIHLMYGPAFDNAVPVMVILAFCLPMMYLGIVFGQVLVAAGRPTVLTAFLVAGGIVNAILNVALVPLFQHHMGNGAIGSALSLLATELLITTAGFVFVGRHVLNRASWSRVARTAVASGAMFVVAFLLRDQGVVALVPAGLTFLVFAFLLGIPTPEERAALTSILRRTIRTIVRRKELDASTEATPTDGSPA